MPTATVYSKPLRYVSKKILKRFVTSWLLPVVTKVWAVTSKNFAPRDSDSDSGHKRLDSDSDSKPAGLGLGLESYASELGLETCGLGLEETRTRCISV